jgi:haloacetate dehalogenase
MFDGFHEATIQISGAEIFVRHGGDGPPVLLLHGHPRTSATWYQVAPGLVETGFTVVCADLRGYAAPEAPPRQPITPHIPNARYLRTSPR